MRRSAAPVVAGLVGLFALLGLLGPQAVQGETSCGGVQLADKLEAFGVPLRLSGSGIRRATVLNVHVYVAGLYLGEPSHDLREILKPSQTKALVLHFVRNVSRSEMLDAIHTGIEDNAGASLAAAKQHMKSFERYLPDLRKGTLLSLAYQPKNGLEVRKNGKLIGVEKDDAFGNLLFRVWLGPKPPDSDLKASLLSGKCQ